MNTTKTEVLVATIARLLEGCRSVVIGNQSPIPGTAALVARELAGGAMRVTILGSRRHTDFTSGGVETFDRAAQGRVDAFFLGGGQIDGEANINLVRAEGRRFPGSFGSAFMYSVVKRTILFREEHSPRVLVPRVEFISARGDPAALLTGKALFSWQKEKRRFRLESVHEPGDIRAETGFDYDVPESIPLTPAPSADELALLRGPVAKGIAPDYPDFAKRVWGIH